jgi:hypothetical protein
MTDALSRLRFLSVLLGCNLLGDVGEHGGALGRLEVLGASLLKQRLGLRPAYSLDWPFIAPSAIAYFFMACLVLKACSFCVAGDMISSEGDTYFSALYLSQSSACLFQRLQVLTAHCPCAIAELDGDTRGSWDCPCLAMMLA